jgi:hypothetical protein
MHLFRTVHWADENADFCTFTNAFLTMFRCATGEGWNVLMHQAMAPSDECDHDSLRRGDCGSWLAVPFFISYVVLQSFVVLKMIVALIIENFVLSLKQEGSRIHHGHTAAFVAAWGEHDPYGTGRIPLAHLFSVLRVLPPPLGLDPARYASAKIRDTDLSRFILSLGLHAYDSRAGDGVLVVTFYDVLGALLDKAFGEELEQMESMEAEVMQGVASKFRTRLEEKVANTTLGEASTTLLARPEGYERQRTLHESSVSVSDHYAVYVIQRKWRTRIEQARRLTAHLFSSNKGLTC